MNGALLPIDIARKLLDRLGHEGDFDLAPLPGGRNNRVWRLRADETDYLLKRYYWAENDRRDRMGHELSLIHI